MEKKFPFIAVIAILFSAAFLGFIYWSSVQKDQVIDGETEQNAPAIDLGSIPEETAAPLTDLKPVVPDLSDSNSSGGNAEDAPKETQQATPKPTPVPLNDSDAHIKTQLKEFSEGNNIIALLTNEEIVRKLVRAIYGVSEGRIVRQYRPISSPKGSFVTNKIGQQTAVSEQELYRISRDNYARYTDYISLLSIVDKDALVSLYYFYLPTFEEAYKELGIGTGDFHTVLLKAIDVILQAPDIQEAMLLTRPSVRYKFSDKKLENLPPAHKLMLRIGGENSEALKLELREIKKRLTKAR